LKPAAPTADRSGDNESDALWRPQVKAPLRSDPTFTAKSQSRVSRPREKVVQQQVPDSFLTSFTELAAPEGSDVPLEEQQDILRAVIELKKTKYVN